MGPPPKLNVHVLFVFQSINVVLFSVAMAQNYVFFKVLPPPWKDHPLYGSEFQKIITTIEEHQLGKPATLGSCDNAPRSSGAGLGGGDAETPHLGVSPGVRRTRKPPLQSGPGRSVTQRLVWQASLLTNVPRGSRLMA